MVDQAELAELRANAKDALADLRQLRAQVPTHAVVGGVALAPIVEAVEGTLRQAIVLADDCAATLAAARDVAAAARQAAADAARVMAAARAQTELAEQAMAMINGAELLLDHDGGRPN